MTIDEIINILQDLETIDNSKETMPSKRIGENVKYHHTQYVLKILQEIELLKY